MMRLHCGFRFSFRQKKSQCTQPCLKFNNLHFITKEASFVTKLLLQKAIGSNHSLACNQNETQRETEKTTHGLKKTPKTSPGCSMNLHQGHGGWVCLQDSSSSSLSPLSLSLPGCSGILACSSGSSVPDSSSVFA